MQIQAENTASVTAETVEAKAQLQVALARIAELEARAVTWAGIVGTLKAERDQLIGVLQIAIERSGDMEHPPAWVDGACAILNRGFLNVDRAALNQANTQQKRIAKLEAALRKLDDMIVDLDFGHLELYQVSDFINDALAGGEDE